MKHKNITSMIIIGALCTVLVIPTFVMGGFHTMESKETIPIRYEIKHWSRQYIDQLLENYDVELRFPH